MRTMIGITIGVLLLTMISFSAVFGSLEILGFSDDKNTFTANVDFAEGVNYYTLVEVDEGDNNEEKVVTVISHEFVFSVNDENGAITWDYGDGTTGTGAITSHKFENPGIYTVTATSISADDVKTSQIEVTVDLEAVAEVDNMECVCAPTAKDTIIELLAQEGQMSMEGYVKVEHDGSSESCTLRNPLQECHVRVILERTESGSVVGQEVLFDDTFRSNELVVDFSLMDLEFEDGEGIQLRLETDQVRDWHKPSAEWSATAPIALS